MAEDEFWLGLVGNLPAKLLLQQPCFIACDEMHIPHLAKTDERSSSRV
jgi:hypothetical protein